MKRFVATFRFPDGAVVTAVAAFATLPGESPVAWSGAVERVLAVFQPPLRRELPRVHYAAQFANSIRHLAKCAGAELVLTESGRWRVYEE
jgi:hypothetical protein